MKKFPFINEARLPFPFCPGCSHGKVLETVAASLEELEIDPLKTVIVTDIGCIGLADQWFTTHAFHGLHGRSVLYGEGLKLASPELTVIVFMGDGGAGIGAHHLIAAARRNIGITVIIFNNFNFGMTGGQHSSTTPVGSITSSSPAGHREFPFRIAETMNINGAAFSARRAFYDRDLTESIKNALTGEGFSLLEILEFCTAYYGEFNRFRKSELEELMDSGTLPRVTLFNEREREYSSYLIDSAIPDSGEEELSSRGSESIPSGSRGKEICMVIAGSAGQKVQSSASLMGWAAVQGGLFAIQQDDYPVTVRTGYSISSLKLSPRQPDYIGIEKPDILIVFSEEGLARTEEYLSGPRRAGKIIAEKRLLPLPGATGVETFNGETLRKINDPGAQVLGVLFHFFRRERIIPGDFLENCLLDSGKIRKESLELIRGADPFCEG